MKILLDTRLIAWLLTTPERLHPDATAALADRSNGLLVSSISAVEVVNKVRPGKWPQMQPLALAWDRPIAGLGHNSSH